MLHIFFLAWILFFGRFWRAKRSHYNLSWHEVKKLRKIIIRQKEQTALGNNNNNNNIQYIIIVACYEYWREPNFVVENNLAELQRHTHTHTDAFFLIWLKFGFVLYCIAYAFLYHFVHCTHFIIFSSMYECSLFRIARMSSSSFSFIHSSQKWESRF